MEKHNAIFFACDNNFLFTLAVALMSLKDHSPKTIETSDILIYYQGFTDKDKELLNNITPCNFVEYYFPLDTDFDNINFKKYTQLAFARYEIFSLLTKYEKVLYLDVDIMINGDIGYIFDNFGDKSGMAMCPDTQKGQKTVAKNFVKPLDIYNMDITGFNSGVTLLCNNIPHCEELRSWCYERTVLWLENLVCPDQGVLNVMAQEFGINIEQLPDICNCIPSNSKYHSKFCKNIIVYHCAGGGVRFWRYSYDSRWEKYYGEYLNMGGTPYVNNDKTWRKRIKEHKLYRYDFFDRSPNPNVHSGRFIKYLLTYPFYMLFGKGK